MNRRQFALGLGAAMIPAMGHAYPSTAYAPATWPDLRDAGNTVVLNFRATWSITCQIKHELITAALADTPAYGRLSFVDVDWDTFGPSVWAERLKVQRRSTLIAVQGTREITRLVNQPYDRSIRNFLDQALVG